MTSGHSKHSSSLCLSLEKHVPGQRPGMYDQDEQSAVRKPGGGRKTASNSGNGGFL